MVAPDIAGPSCVMCEEKRGTMTYFKKWYCSYDCIEAHANREQFKFQKYIKVRGASERNDKIMQEAARAGAMATLLFEMLVEKTWTVPIRTWVPVQSDKPEVEGVYVSLGPGDNSKRLGGGWFYPFETEKGEEEFPEVYRHAVLADGNSIWALVIAGAIVRVMFEDIVKDVSADIKEVIHTKKTGLFRVVKYLDQHGQQTEREDQVYPDTDGVGVFEIMLKSGDKIALQMTVEQFKGHHLPHERNFVMLWEEYMELYAGKMTERSVFGTALKNHARLVNSCDHHTHLHIILHIIEEFQVFILKYARGEDAFLNPVSRVTKEDRMINFRGEMIRFLNDAKSRLDFIIMSIDQGNSSMDPLVKKHPKYGHDNIYTHYGREMIVTDFNPGIKNFNWDIVKQVASGEGFNHTVRKEARDLLACKAVYAPWNDHKFVFDPFPREKLPDLPHDRMSLNPHWDGKRKISKS